MKFRAVTAALVVLIAVAVVSSQQQGPTDKERIEQARELLLPLDAKLEGAARTNLRNILTRMLTLIGQLPDDPAPPPPPPPPPLTEICGNGIDDDGDGQIDEGCQGPPPPGGHAEYSKLCALSGARCYSLRDPAELAQRKNGGYSRNNSVPPSCNYDAKADAAKCVIPKGAANLQNQVRLPIPDHTGQSLLVSWDAYFDSSWIGGGLSDQKTWQLSCGGQKIHTEIRNRYQQGANQKPGSVAKVDGRQYSQYGPNVADNEPLAPMANAFYVQPNRWTRWIAHLKAPSGGSTYYEYSLWLADEQTPPVLVYDRLQIAPCSGRWDFFWLEFNTSSNQRSTTGGDLTAWVRNVLMVVGAQADSPSKFLVKP